MGNLNKIFNSLNVVSDGSSYNTIGFRVSKSGSTANPGITSFIVRDDGSTGVNITLPTSMLTVSGDCRITDLPTGGRLMVTADSIGKLHTQPIPGFPPVGGTGCTLTGITVVGQVITFHVVGTGCTSFTASTIGSNLSPYRYNINGGTDAIEPILPGNNFADAAFSNIQGGTNNLIEAGSFRSSILGGLANRLVNNSRWSSILGGIGNRLDDAQVSTIVSGQDNDILIAGGTSGYGAILNGFENLVNHQYSVIMGGANMTTDRDFTVFMRGLDVDTDAFDPLGVMQQSPFRYHGTYANNGNPGDVLTSVDALGNARWRPSGFPNAGTGCTVTGITIVGPVITFHTTGSGCTSGSFTASTVGSNLSPYEYGVGSQSIKPILGSLQTTGIASSIGGGTNNHIQGSHSARIGGGVNNLISGSTGSGIHSGSGNRIQKGLYGHISAGVQNKIGTETLSVYSSFIGAGAYNNIVGTYGYNVIGGGEQNEIGREWCAIGQGWSNIVGGYDNSIFGRYLAYSSIVGGYRNIISGSTHAFIGGGNSNKIFDKEGTLNYGSIVGGLENHIFDSRFGFIGGGEGNKLDERGDYNVIGGGKLNTVGNRTNVLWANYSSILGGEANKIFGDGVADYAAIVNGSGNTVEQRYSAVIGGRGLRAIRSHTTFMQGLDVDTNHDGVTRPFRYHGTFANNGNPGDVLTAVDALGNAQWQPKTWGTISGDCYVVSATTNSATCVTTFYLNGNCGTLTASTCDGSFSPYRPIGNQSIVPTVPAGIAFNTNVIDWTSANSNVGGGVFNRILNGSANSVVAGGRNNRIVNNSQWSNIGGGVSNMIDDSRVSSILGGHQNDINIPGFANGYGLITAGFQNLVTEEYGSIINGRDNIVSEEYGSIINGRDNIVSNENSAIIGSSTKTTDRDFTTFMEGLDVDTNRGGLTTAQAFKYHGTWAQPGLNYVLTDIDGTGNAQWQPVGVENNPDCPYVSAYTTNQGCTLNLINCTGGTFTADTCNSFGSISPYEFSQGTDGIVPILPLGAAENRNPTGTYNRIGGGDTNHIYYNSLSNLNVPPLTFMVKNNTIGNGSTNTISGASLFSTTTNGFKNVQHAIYSVIGNGKQNRIGSSHIILGSLQYRMGIFDTIGNGEYNFIQGTHSNLGRHRDIFNGYSNIINSASTYTSIVNGRLNKIANSDYSSILGGKSNIVQARYAAIVNGSGNTITRNTIGSAIIGAIGRSAANSETTYTRGLDTNTDGYDGVDRPFKYHGTYASEGTPGHVLTSVDTFGNAHWAPGGVVWTYGCPIVSAYTTNSGCILNLVNCSGGTITADTCNSFGMLSPYEYRGGVDSISTVLPNSAALNTNFIANNLSYSNIQGGAGNSLNSSGQHNAILGGNENWIGSDGQASPQGNIYWSTIGGGSGNNIRGYDTMGGVIGGGSTNVLTATTNSVISGGYRNRVTGGQKHTIGGGGQNKINGSEGNAIVGGQQNQVWNGENNLIGGGSDNNIIDFTGAAAPVSPNYSLITGGFSNTIEGGSTSAIVGGTSNEITSNEPAHMFIGGGNSNFINNSSSSSIVGGQANMVQNSARGGIFGGEDNTVTNSSYTSILGGFQNTINPGVGAGTDYSAIVNGSDNTIQHLYSAIIGGGNLTTDRQYTTFMEGLDVNTTRGGLTNAQAFKYHGTWAQPGVNFVLTSVDNFGNAQWQPLGIPPVSGDCYVVSASTNSATCVTTFYLNGDCGTVTASTCDGSFSPYRPTGTDSIVPTVPGVGGFGENIIDIASNNSNVGGGRFNRITDNSDSAVIAGGRSNRLRNGSQWSSIGGGVSNIIDDSRVSSIVGGHQNNINIAGFSNGYGLITGGFQNTVTEAYGSIINGRNNTVQDQYSAIIGSQNRTTDRAHTTFMEGLDVDTNRGGATNSQAFKYYGTFADPGPLPGKVLTDVDGLGNAVWMDLPNPSQNPDCPFVSAFTTNSGCILNLINCTGGTFTAETCNSFGGVSPYTIGAGLDSIEPVMMIGSANAIKSNVQGGLNHNIDSTSSYSSIVGGKTNNIALETHAAFIGNGVNNTITDASGYSSIVGGGDNLITDKSGYSSIVGGKNNTVNGGAKVVIVGGWYNMVTGSSLSSIVSGKFNKVNFAQSSNISSGENNKIVENTFYSTIGAGTYNSIRGGSTGPTPVGTYSSAIAAGYYNTITKSPSSNPSSYSFIGSGRFNVLSGAPDSTIVSGYENKIIQTEGGGAILSGRQNLIKTAGNSVIVNGTDNTINGGWTSSAVIGADDRVVDRAYTTFMEGLDVDTNRGGATNSQAFKYYGTFANEGLNRVLTSVDNFGNAKWMDGGPISVDSNCPIVSAYTTNSGCTLNLVDCSGNTFTANTCTTFGSYSPYQIGASGAFQSIEPTLSPLSAQATWSSVGGGFVNRISPGSLLSRIGGGQVNMIKGTSLASYIGGGQTNIISGSSSSVIVGGTLNYITNTSTSAIVGGSSNKIGKAGGSNNSYNFVGGGVANWMTDETEHSSIVGGFGNSINNDSDYNFIGGGKYNNLGDVKGPLWTNYSSILGGERNKIAGDGVADYAAIVNGSGNTVERHYSAIIGGRGLTANRTHTTFMQGLDVNTDHDGVTRPFTYHGGYANNGNPGDVLTAVDASGNARWMSPGLPTVSGDCYVVSASTHTGSCITTFFLGDCGTVTAKTCDGSYSPYRPTGDNSIVPTLPVGSAADTNVIDNLSSNSNVGGGVHNRVMDSDNSVVGGGRYNRIVEHSEWSNIGGGVSNIIRDSRVSSILGGHQNEIDVPGTSNGYGLITGGYQNKVDTLGTYGSVINGSNNTVSHTHSAIIGSQNRTTDRTYTTFTEGLDVDSRRANGSADGQAFKYHGTFADPGTNRLLTSVDNLGNAQWRDSGIAYLGDEVVVSAQTIGCVLTLTTNSGNTITANTCTTYSGPYTEGQGWNNIIPTLPGIGLANYTDPTSAWSNIQGGLLNFMGGGIGSSILGGIGNRITGSTYSAIISGQGGKIKDSQNSVIVNGMANTITSGATSSVIMGGGGIKAYTPQTTYMGYQQVLGRARISSTEYNNTNSLNSEYPKGTLDVVHDNSTITNLTADQCGGEIVRFGDWDGTYAKGKLVQLRNGAWTEAKAVDTTMQGNMLGIALGATVAGEGVLIRGFFNADTAYDAGGGWTGGLPLYVHTGGGQISPTVPSASSEYVRNIGYVVNSGQKYVYFNPESTYIVVH